MKVQLKELHGVTLSKKGNTFQVRYGRTSTSTDNGLVALEKFNDYVLIVLDEYASTDLYYPYSNK